MTALPLRLPQRHVVALPEVDQCIPMPAPRAQEEAPVLIDLGLDGGEHHSKVAASALPHGVAPVRGDRTPSWSDGSWWPRDPHESYWHARDLEAQARRQDRGY